MSGGGVGWGAQDDPLRGVEQYPGGARTPEAWPPARRAAYLQALEELHRAGKLSRREFEKTMVERGEAEARYRVRRRGGCRRAGWPPQRRGVSTPDAGQVEDGQRGRGGPRRGARCRSVRPNPTLPDARDLL